MDKEEESPFHLDDRLRHPAAFEDPGGTRGQRGEPGGDGCELIRAVARETFRQRQKKSVGGHDDGVGHPGVLSTKLVINQFRFCAAWLIGLN